MRLRGRAAAVAPCGACAPRRPRPGPWSLVVALLPGVATAQSRLDFTHSLGMTHGYDDNIFSRPTARQEDYVSRISPRMGASYRSRTLSLSARCGLDAEMFQHHTELNTLRGRQEALVEARYLPSPRLTMGFSAGYLDTQTPGELNVITGLEPGRAPASRLYLAQSLARTLGPRTRIVVDHSFTRDRISPRPANDTQTAGLGLVRQLGPSDTGRLDYGFKRFAFDRDLTISHAFTLGWSRAVTSLATFELQAGPRLTGHRLGAEVAVTLRHRFRRGDVALTFLETQAMIAGQPEPVAVRGGSGTFGRQLGRSLSLRGAAGVFSSRSATLTAMVYRLNLEATWRFARMLAVTASHQSSLQREGPDSMRREDTFHSGFLLGLVAGTTGN